MCLDQLNNTKIQMSRAKSSQQASRVGGCFLIQAPFFILCLHPVSELQASDGKTRQTDARVFADVPKTCFVPYFTLEKTIS